MMKNNRNQHHRSYAAIFILISILAILILSLNQANVLGTAAVVDREPLAEGEYQVGCVDSDPLNYFNVKGFVKHKKYQYNDYCVDGKLYQAYCASSNVVRMTRRNYCRNGCGDGVCL